MRVAVLCSHYVHYIVSNRNMTDKDELVKDLEGSGCRLIEALSRIKVHEVA
jgi:hypothetical protein